MAVSGSFCFLSTNYTGSGYSFILIAAFLSLATSPCISQQKKKEDARELIAGLKSEWSEGSVMLKDGNELQGVLRYNENTGVLSVDAEGKTRSLSARSSLGFEYYDAIAQKQRVFYSLEYENDEGVPAPVFFEVLFQFKRFAVLRRLENMRIKEKNKNQIFTDKFGQPLFNDNSTYVAVEQDETFYLMSEGGQIKPFVLIKSKDRNLDVLDNERTKIENEDFLEELIGKDAYDNLRQYSSYNNLSFKDRKEMVKLFEYYKQKWEP